MPATKKKRAAPRRKPAAKKRRNYQPTNIFGEKTGPPYISDQEDAELQARGRELAHTQPNLKRGDVKRHIGLKYKHHGLGTQAQSILWYGFQHEKKALKAQASRNPKRLKPAAKKRRNYQPKKKAPAKRNSRAARKNSAGTTDEVLRALKAQGHEVLTGKGGFFIRGKGHVSMAQARKMTGLTAPERQFRPRMSSWGDYATVEMFARKRKNKTARNSRAARSVVARFVKHVRKNPFDLEQAAEKLYADFHGQPPARTQVVTESEEYPVDLVDLGKLIRLDILTEDGEHFLRIDAKGNTRLTSTPNGGQLYFIGGDQSLDLEQLGIVDDAEHVLKDHVTIGPVHEIWYHTRKGFHDFEPIDYHHTFAEDDETDEPPLYLELPTLNYDTINRKIYLTGGSYRVRPEGIVN